MADHDLVEGVFTPVGKCSDCGTIRPTTFPRADPGDQYTQECWGRCDGETIHDITARNWCPYELLFECPECGYETLFFEEEFLAGPPLCNECEPEGSDDMYTDLLPVAGVTEDKMIRLNRAGYVCIGDLREASQEELSEVEGIGYALAALIKSDVGVTQYEKGITKMRLAEVRMRGDTGE